MLFASEGKIRLQLPLRGKSNCNLPLSSNGVGKAGGTAEANASRLLKKAKIFDRVQELQQEHYKRVNKKIDLSKERVGRRLDLASTLAEQDRYVQGIVASELGIAKVFRHIEDKQTDQIDFQT